MMEGHMEQAAEQGSQGCQVKVGVEGPVKEREEVGRGDKADKAEEQKERKEERQVPSIKVVGKYA